MWVTEPVDSRVLSNWVSILVQRRRKEMGASLVGSQQGVCPLEPYGQIHRNHHPRGSLLTVTRVVRTQKGGSQSRLVTCDDGRLYVLKMHPNPQGPNVLANEALGSILLRGLGLCAPPWKQVTINLKTLRLFPDLSMYTADGGPTFPACGVHFGSEYLGGPLYRLFDFMPRSHLHKLRNASQLLPMYLFDIWASHQDTRQCVYTRLREADLYDTFFIDNGHLFGGPTWQGVAGPARTIPSDILEPITVGDPRIEQCLKLFEKHIPQLLHRAVAAVPPEWYRDDIYALYARLMWRLEFLRLLVAGDILGKAHRMGSIPLVRMGRAFNR
jgi:hypothetical protein